MLVGISGGEPRVERFGHAVDEVQQHAADGAVLFLGFGAFRAGAERAVVVLTEHKVATRAARFEVVGNYLLTVLDELFENVVVRKARLTVARGVVGEPVGVFGRVFFVGQNRAERVSVDDIALAEVH